MAIYLILKFVSKIASKAKCEEIVWGKVYPDTSLHKHTSSHHIYTHDEYDLECDCDCEKCIMYSYMRDIGVEMDVADIK